MFTLRANTSDTMTKWVRSFSRDFEPEALTRFAPKTRAQTPETTERAQPRFAVEEAPACAHAAQPKAIDADPRMAPVAKPDLAPRETVHPKRSENTAVEEDLFDIPLNVLRKALPRRFAEIDGQTLSEARLAADEFRFAQRG